VRTEEDCAGRFGRRARGDIAVCAVLMAGVTVAASAHDVRAPHSIEHLPLEKVSPHVHVVHGALERPSLANRGFMNNPAVIVTSGGIIVVDPGSSAAIGRELVRKARRLSDKPVIAVFNTHVHGDHWLGNHGVRELFPRVPIYAHARMIERVRDGAGARWTTLFARMTGGATAKTRPVGPSVGLTGGEQLKLGGLTLRIHHPGHAHTDHDLILEVVEDRSLILGDVVVAQHVPNSDVPDDASFAGTQAAVESVLRMPVTHYIPGHGRSGGREVPEASLRFLRQLKDSVTRHYRQGLQDYEMKERVIAELAEYRHWHNFGELGRVIGFVFREVERDSF